MTLLHFLILPPQFTVQSVNFASYRPCPKKSFRLQVKQLGPIREADITFGDLTVIVGPQATGKSILLQTIKLCTRP
jgi:ABC-type uncharacterized transport system ATPase subunit